MKLTRNRPTNAMLNGVSVIVGVNIGALFIGFIFLSIGEISRERMDGFAHSLGSIDGVIAITIAVASLILRAMALKTAATFIADWVRNRYELRLVDLAVLLAGRKRAWSKKELLAGLAYSRGAEHPSTRAARLYHAADLVRGAAKMRAHDVYTVLIRPVSKLRWAWSPGVPSMLVALIMALYFFATGGGFTAIIDHIQDICDAGGIAGLIELGARQLRRYRSE